MNEELKNTIINRYFTATNVNLSTDDPIFGLLYTAHVDFDEQMQKLNALVKQVENAMGEAKSLSNEQLTEIDKRYDHARKLYDELISYRESLVAELLADSQKKIIEHSKEASHQINVLTEANKELKPKIGYSNILSLASLLTSTASLFLLIKML